MTVCVTTKNPRWENFDWTWIHPVYGIVNKVRITPSSPKTEYFSVPDENKPSDKFGPFTTLLLAKEFLETWPR